MKNENKAKIQINLKAIKKGNIFLSRFDMIIFFFSFIISLCNDNLVIQNYISEVTIKIKGNGTQKILYPYFHKKPDEIYLNGNKVNSSNYSNYESIFINGKEETNNIIKIIWKNFDGNLVNAFQYLSNLIEIDLSKLNATVNNMANLFVGCTSLKSVNLSNLDTSKVANMGHLFADCKSLTSIDLSSFNTSNVLYMDNMFLNCFSLTSLNLFNFDTKSVIKIDYMFKNCTSLTSLNLSNFKISGNDDISNIFMDCRNLEYLNLYNIKILGNQNDLVIRNIIGNISKISVICINKDAYKDLNVNECITFDCSENWITKKKKIFASNGSCVDDCIYLYENKCYDECPEDTIYNGIVCENLSIEELFLKKYKNKEDKDKFKENILSSIKDGSLIKLISSKVNNDSYFIINNENDNDIYLISTLENQMHMENITLINFSECEKLLKKDSENNEELYTFRIDHNIEGYNIPIIEYVIFNENGTILNLDKCKNVNTNYFIPVSINENNLFIHDPSSDYYNDECNQYKTENGSDMTIYDRKNNYNDNHLSLCEANCTFKGYNSSTLKAECECKIKSYLYSKDDLTDDNLLNKLENEQKLTNLNLMKCSNLLSSADNIKNNPSFYLIGIIIVLFIIVMIIFCLRGYNTLENKIDEIIAIKFKNQKNSNTIKDIFFKKKETQKKTENKKSNTNSKHNIINRTRKIVKKNNKKLIIKGNNNKKENKNDNFMKYSNDYEINNLNYQLAIKHDKRELCEYYFSLIRTKQLLFFSFCDFNDYNSGIVKKFIFFLSFALHYTINALFFNDKTMHQIYQDEGKYNFIYQLPYITFSAIISTFILRIMLASLVLTDKSVLEVKNQKTKILASGKKKQVLKYMIVKYSIFFVLNLILLIIFGYYLSCFNALYPNTQVDLIINTSISFVMSCFYPFIINIIPAIIRISALQNKKTKGKIANKNHIKGSEYTYKVSQWLQIL